MASYIVATFSSFDHRYYLSLQIFHNGDLGERNKGFAEKCKGVHQKQGI